MTESTIAKNLSGIPPSGASHTEKELEMSHANLNRRAVLAATTVAKMPGEAKPKPKPKRAESGPRWPRKNPPAHEPLRRAAQVVTALKEAGAPFDECRSERFLENLCLFNPDDGDDDPRFGQILEWVSDHGQSLDWIFSRAIRKA
jgi:hypothetical protein